MSNSINNCESAIQGMVESRVLQMLKRSRTFNEYHTHVQIGSITGKHCINRDDIDAFFDAYCQEFDKFDFCIAEKVQTYLPVLVDVDIKLPKGDERRYNAHQLESVVRDYQEVLSNIIDGCKPEHLICFVLEKAAYESKDNVKNGFHLHFPYVFLSKNDHLSHLLPRVKKLIDKSKVFQSLGFEKSGDLIDGCYVKNPWLMYGSKKDQGMQPYLLTKILNQDRDEITIEDALQHYKIYDQDENEISIKGNFHHYLPRVLSVIQWYRRPCEIKPNLPSLVAINVVKKNDDEKENFPILQLSEKLVTAGKLVAMMSDKRSDNYSDWMKVGWALHHESEGHENGLQMWLQFSSRSSKYDEDACIALWEKMNTDKVTMGTLHHYAKEDNPDAYKTYMADRKKANNECAYTTEQLEEFIELFKNQELGLAEVYYRVYGKDNIKSSDQKGNVIYVWNEHRQLWLQQSLSFLQTSIAEVLLEVQRQIICHIVNQPLNHEDQVAITKRKELMNMINKAFAPKSKLCKNIGEFLKTKIFDENAEKMLNDYKHVFPCKGGLKVDLKTLELSERTKEDMFTYELDVNYLANKKTPNIDKFIMQLMRDDTIYPEDEEKEREANKASQQQEQYNYFRKILGYSITGENYMKIFQIWYGSKGNNGKSTLANMIENIFGSKLVSAVDHSVVTSYEGDRKRAGQANSALVATKGLHMGFVNENENDHNCVLNLGLIKALASGGKDAIVARQLYGEQQQFIPKLKIAYLCNDIPRYNSIDVAFSKERLKMVAFRARFENTKENSEYVEDIKTNKKDEFFTWLCNAAKAFYDNPVIEVSSASKSLADNANEANNPLSEFIDARCARGDKYKVKSSELYEAYTSFVQAGSKKLSAKEFANNMEKMSFASKKSNGCMHWLKLQLKQYCHKCNHLVDALENHQC